MNNFLQAVNVGNPVIITYAEAYVAGGIDELWATGKGGRCFCVRVCLPCVECYQFLCDADSVKNQGLLIASNSCVDECLIANTNRLQSTQV